MDERRGRKRRKRVLVFVILFAAVLAVIIAATAWRQSAVRRYMEIAQTAAMILDKNNPLSVEYFVNVACIKLRLGLLEPCQYQ